MKVLTPAVWLALMLASVAISADGPPAPVPADFKLIISSYGLGDQPVYTEDVVVHLGRIYVFPSNMKEVTIIEPARGRLDLIDVGRKVQCEVTFEALDAAIIKVRAGLIESAEKLEKQGGKGKLIEARMARELTEVKLDQAYDPKIKRVRLKNAVVEVDADGEDEPDDARRALVTATLVNIARLGAYRAPNDLPPFIELEAIAALSGERKLRPTSISYLYRLAGPPTKMRRTYKIVPGLTDRENEAIQRVDRLREVAPSLRYEKYRTDQLPAGKSR